MQRTYEGTLYGNQIVWSGEAPTSEQSLRVQVTVTDDTNSESDRGARMAAALDRLAQSGCFANIKDPSIWQRNVRSDRNLPGREAE